MKLLLFSFLTAIAMAAAPILAEPTQAASTQQKRAYSPHYLFSNYFGPGLYSTSDQDITVFNLPFSYTPKSQAIRANLQQVNYKIRLPVSLGFYNFALDDIDEFRIGSTANATLTLGAEVFYPITAAWQVKPFFDVGYSENSSNDDSAMIYAAGISSYYYFPWLQQTDLFFAQWQWARYHTQKTHISDIFSSLQIGADFKWPLRFDLLQGEGFISTYISGSWYMLDLSLGFTGLDPRKETSSQEIGLTFGRKRPLNLGLLSLERIGLGYRYSSTGPNAIRLFINKPF